MKKKIMLSCKTIVAFLLINVPPLYAINTVNGDLIVFNRNGGWCWYQDERVIVDNGKVILGSVADASGSQGYTRNGNMEITTYDISSGSITINGYTEGDLSMVKDGPM